MAADLSTAGTNLPDIGYARLDYRKLFGQPLPSIDFNPQFRIAVMRPGLGNAVVDGICETLEWKDEGGPQLSETPILQGTVGLRKPTEGLGDVTLIEEGDVFDCKVLWGGTWRPLWQMRNLHPDLEESDGTWTFDLADDLQNVQRNSSTNLHYKRNKKHPHGWLPHQITLDVCRRFRIPVGTLVRGKYPITEMSANSPLEMIQNAYDHEAKYTGRHYVVSWRVLPSGANVNAALSAAQGGRVGGGGVKGRLTVLPLRRNPLLYILKDQLVTAHITSQIPGTLATVLTCHGTMKVKGGKKKKVSYTDPPKSKVKSDSAVQRFGYIHDTEEIHGNLRSVHELVDKAKRARARRLQPNRAIEITHPGIPFVRRGDAMEIFLPQDDFAGKKSIAFVQNITHSVAAGDYTMDITFMFIDPYDPAKVKKEREAAARARARALRTHKFN